MWTELDWSWVWIPVISPLASEGETKIKEKRKGECGHNAPRRWKAPSLPERPLLCGERRRGRSPNPAPQPAAASLRSRHACLPHLTVAFPGSRHGARRRAQGARSVGFLHLAKEARAGCPGPSLNPNGHPGRLASALHPTATPRDAPRLAAQATRVCVRGDQLGGKGYGQLT